jgi:hypothetical protein
MDKKPSQTSIIYDLLLSGNPISTYQIAKAVGGENLIRISERIREIKKQKNVEIVSFRDDQNKSLWWYQLKPEIPLSEMPEYRKWNKQLWGGLENKIQSKLL